MNKQVSPLGQILMDQARDLAHAQLAGKPLDRIVSEGAARIAAHYQPKPCRFCGAEQGDRFASDKGLCNPCYRDLRGPFEFERDDGSDE